MGDEIYEYILKKLDDAVIESSSSEFHLAAKLFLRPNLSQQFKDLKELIQEKRAATVTAAAAAATATVATAAATADESNTAIATSTAAVVDKSSIAPATAADQANLLREQLYCINNVLMEWQMITKKHFSISRESVTSLTNLSQSLKKIKQDLSLKKNKQEGGSATTINLDPNSDVNVGKIGTEPTTLPNTTTTISEEPGYRWSSQYIDVKEVHGIEDKVLSMERLLVLRRDKNDPFKAFGIFGMAGIGKTTLCQSIFSRPKVKEYFLPRIWVCMSKQKDEDTDPRKETVKRMLMCLGVDNEIIKKTDQGQNLGGLIFALRLQLTGKRYLIVLDDAWSNDGWFKLMDSGDEDENSGSGNFAYGLPKGCGGTVIVTSRKKEVVKNMVGEEQNLRCLMPLTDSETCWKIFQDWVQKDGIEFPEGLEKLKEEIVKRCDGLPLAAKMMGEIKHQQIIQSVKKANQPGAAQQAAGSMINTSI